MRARQSRLMRDFLDAALEAGLAAVLSPASAYPTFVGGSVVQPSDSVAAEQVQHWGAESGALVLANLQVQGVAIK